MFIPDNLIRDLGSNTRPVVLYRNKYGDVIYGFVLRPDEFVTNLSQLTKVRKMAGLKTVDDVGNPL